MIVQTVFGMNVTELNDGSKPNVARYLELAIPLTAVTIWIIVSLQSKAHLDDADPSMWSQIWWPVTSLMDLFTHVLRRPRRGDDYARV